MVIDLFSRAILGWKLSESLHAELVTGALGRACNTGLVQTDAIFHSDRGCQYSSVRTRALLARRRLRQSVNRLTPKARAAEQTTLRHALVQSAIMPVSFNRPVKRRS